MVYNVMKMVCIIRIVSIGSVSEVSFYSFSFINVIVRNNDKFTLFSTDIVRLKTR